MVEKGKERAEVVKGGHEVVVDWRFEHGLEAVGTAEERERRRVRRSTAAGCGGGGGVSGKGGMGG